MRATRSRAGFTLVELMIASAISVSMVTALVSMFVQQRRAYKSMQLINEMEQNVRVAADMLARDTRMAGYGLNVPLGTVGSWITWVPGVSNYIQITQGGSGAPDTVKIVAALDAPLGALNAATAVGANTLQLGSGQGGKFNLSNKKLIFVGKTETARITSISGDTLTISTDATSAGAGLRYAYPVGAGVELVKVVTYDWRNDPYNYPYVPHLRRDENIGTATFEWQKITASHIENFQAASSTGGVVFTVTGRSSVPDQNYVDPSKDDRYRRRAVTFETRLRRPLQ